MGYVMLCLAYTLIEICRKVNVQMNLQKLMDTSYRKTLILKTLAWSDDDVVYIRKSDFI